MNFNTLAKIAVQAALDAGALIEKHLGTTLEVRHKGTGQNLASQVVTDIDIACEKLILSHLLPSCHRYDLALLSEERPDDGSRFEKEYFWCIDPLDGTLPFIQNRPGFSVSIALVAQDGSPVIGVVYDPVKRNLYQAIKGEGVLKNDKPWVPLKKNNYLTYVTDKTLEETPSRAGIESSLEGITKEMNLEKIVEKSGGGSVMNAIYVLENAPACLIKLPKKEDGGGSIWDFAATACIFNELQHSATNYDGDPLALNKRENTFMNDQGIFFSSIENSK
ncbi:MAG: 3'(2'),5'-bisphosphate nucleotidase CysQ family protein [Flavobacteriaceae bacterium]